MHVFILIALRSQIECIPQRIRNGSQEAFLLWLSQHGEMSEWSGHDDTFYSFRSWWGIETTFTFPPDGDISIQGKYIHMRMDS